MCGRSPRQLGLLLYKNLLLRRRHYVATIQEVAIPVAFAALLLLIRVVIKVKGEEPQTVWPEFQTLQFPSNISALKIAYAPNTVLAKQLTDEITSSSFPYITRAVGFATEQEMVKNITGILEENRYIGSIVFTSLVDSNAASLPSPFSYTLRFSAVPRGSKRTFGRNPNWQTDRSYPSLPALGPREKEDQFGGKPGYYSTGFLYLQARVDAAVMSLAGVAPVYNVSMQRIPYPPYENDPFITFVSQSQLGFFLMLSFIFTFTKIVRNVLMEKEKRLKETMKMMGLKSWLHWTAWYLNHFLLGVVALILIVLIFIISTKEGKIIKYSDVSVMFVFLVLYLNSIIFFAFALTTFFDTARSGATWATILFVVSYFPFSFMQNRIDDVPLAVKAVSCLLPNMGLALGANLIGIWENTGTGIHWYDIARPAYALNEFTMLHVFGMQLVSALLYMLIAWYKENVRPGAFGYPLPWYFPFTRSYWRGQVILPMSTAYSPADALNPNIEPDPQNLQCSIAIDNLTKVFGSGRQRKTAVDDLRLRIYQGQITALLGHNGAGKTTTMAMITGFIPPTLGNVLVNGISIRNSVAGVRKQLGLCPQQNVLFDDLTVWEHLWFFAKLKDFPDDRMDAEINRLIAATHLEPKRNWLSSRLSGGMKRKLCVAIAMIGDSKVVILDEPTSGMDPSARRELWTFLQAERTGRTILLTTHFMDEADVLGDRIAIMSAGKLQCAGSSLFLKSRYGAGYHLTMVKAAGCKEAVVTQLIKSVIPSAELESNVADELTYVLPTKASSSFETLFSRLESDKETLRIASIGASVTTMEEVFLKVSSDAETANGCVELNHHGANGSIEVDEVADTSMRRVDENPTEISVSTPYDSSWPKNSGLRLFFQQFWGILVKRMLITRRSFILTAVQLIVPVIFLVIGLLVLKTGPGNAPGPALELTLKNYKKPIVGYGRPASAVPTADVQSLLGGFKKEFSTGLDVSLANFTEHVLVNRTDALDWFAGKAKKDLALFNQRYIIGAYAESDRPPVALFNNEAYHSPAIALNAMSNAFLRGFANRSQKVVATNHPLPKSKTQSADSSSVTALPAAINAVFGLSILSGSFCLFVVRERVTKVKHLHFVAGTFKSAYWLATLAWDLLCFLVPSVLLTIVFLIFGEKAYSGTAERVMGVFLLLVLYGWAVLPQMYLLSYIYETPPAAFQWQSFFNVVSGIATMTVVFIFESIDDNLKNAAKILKHLFMFVFPGYGVGQGLSDYYSNYEITQACVLVQPLCSSLLRNNSCCKDTCTDNCFEWTEKFLSLEGGGIGLSLLGLSIQGLVYLSICLLVETSVFSRLVGCLSVSNCTDGNRKSSKRKHSDVQMPEDDDLVQQRNDVAKPEAPASKLLVFRDLTRFFGSHCAVQNISCGIARGECFGLLGVNGAGKTTTFKMLTGDLAITSGEIFVNGISVSKQVRDVQRQLGYCPQFDALHELLSARETLTLFARLRGQPEALIGREVDQLIDSLLLGQYADRLAGTYSGGNKRKLSAAVAMVGGPPVVCLDEPTSGMDAVARRHLWRALSDYRLKGNTLVLTSHSMEECEALCTKIVIMVNGQFKCFGSCQHLKAKFGSGYTLLAQVPFGNNVGGDCWVVKLKEFVEGTFPSSVLKDFHQGILHYQLEPSEGLTWSNVFGAMERSKEDLKLENYSVSQTTLEQIFIHFARNQEEPEERNSGCQC